MFLSGILARCRKQTHLGLVSHRSHYRSFLLFSGTGRLEKTRYRLEGGYLTKNGSRQAALAFAVLTETNPRKSPVDSAHVVLMQSSFLQASNSGA